MPFMEQFIITYVNVKMSSFTKVSKRVLIESNILENLYEKQQIK